MWLLVIQKNGVFNRIPDGLQGKWLALDMNILQKSHWQAVLAILLGSALLAMHGILVDFVPAIGRADDELNQILVRWLGGETKGSVYYDQWQYYAMVSLRIQLFTVTPVLCAYGVVSKLFSPENQSGYEMQCRKCRYILKGISEPRCPECGEWI